MRKPSLSPSKLTTYLACPAKYRFTYLDPEGRWYLRSKSYYSFGSTLHGVLQRFHDSQDAGVTSTHEALAAMEESWISAGYASQEEMNQAMADGKLILANYLETVQTEPITAKTLFVEKQLRADLGRFVLIGRVDRVDEHDDGTLEIIDYKSGRQGVSSQEVATDIAMCCYQLLLRERFPDRPVMASIVALRTGVKASASLSPDELEQFKGDVTFLGHEILDRDYPNLMPLAKAMCGDCDFLPLCRRHSEFSFDPADYGPAQR